MYHIKPPYNMATPVYYNNTYKSFQNLYKIVMPIHHNNICTSQQCLFMIEIPVYHSKPVYHINTHTSFH